MKSEKVEVQDLTVKEAQEKIKELLEYQKESLRPFSISSKIAMKIISEYPDSMWYEKSQYEQFASQASILLEKHEDSTDDFLLEEKDLERFKILIEDYLLIIIENDQTKELSGIYITGIPVGRFQTKGGKKFTEALPKVDTYNPSRQNMFGGTLRKENFNDIL